MWPWILGSAALGGLTGGIQGYQRSGGKLGDTLQGVIGGGLSGGLMGGIGAGAQRMAGQALEGLLASGAGQKAASAVAPEAFKVAEGLAGLKAGGIKGAQQAVTQAGLQPPMAQQMGGLSVLGKATPALATAGGLAAGLAVPALAAPLIGASGNLVKQGLGGGAQAARAALGFATKGDPGTGAYPGGAVPDVNDPLFGGRLLGTNIMDAYDPTNMFATARALQQLQAQTELANLKLIEPYKAQMAEGAKKAEYQRQASMAALRQNIATQAALLQGGVGAAQQMGTQASQDIGRALTQQYQYS